jgi:hypothetical protein
MHPRPPNTPHELQKLKHRVEGRWCAVRKVIAAGGNAFQLSLAHRVGFDRGYVLGVPSTLFYVPAGSIAGNCNVTQKIPTVRIDLNLEFRGCLVPDTAEALPQQHGVTGRIVWIVFAEIDRPIIPRSSEA